ncbi:MAG: SDR family NAD(P)-dependent oxidoreductase [Kiritimatiellae bacterium]|nr:SDR family NAD(P)-dependent oxidoreductase [Kiritimatiellia bacterium]
MLVTGCSTGIGAATALFLKEHGWNVVPTARRPEDLDRLRGQGFTPVALDLLDSGSIEQAVDETLRIFGGRIGGIVNNAGYGQPGAIEDLTRDQMRRQFEVNVFGLQELTNRLLPVFHQQGWGRIVNISSVVGRVAIPFSGIYGASKHALEGMSDALRVELHGTGIAVVIIEPGPIDTAFYQTAAHQARSLLDRDASRFTEEYRREVEGRPVRKATRERFMQGPEAVAKRILHALESPRPRTRYPVTIPAWIGTILRRFLPDRAVDMIVLRRAWRRRKD